MRIFYTQVSGEQIAYEIENPNNKVFVWEAATGQYEMPRVECLLRIIALLDLIVNVNLATTVALNKTYGDIYYEEIYGNEGVINSPDRYLEDVFCLENLIRLEKNIFKKYLSKKEDRKEIKIFGKELLYICKQLKEFFVDYENDKYLDYSIYDLENRIYTKIKQLPRKDLSNTGSMQIEEILIKEYVELLDKE